MSEITKKYIVKGKVQGVWYRDSTQKKAYELGLTGYVQNLTDGSVELIATGSPDILQKLEDWLWQGPQEANVSNVLSEPSYLKKFTDFCINW